MSSPELNARGPIAWMARNPVAANLLMAVILLLGGFGIQSVKMEVFPEFTIDVVNVSVPYPGASPAEVEQGIVLAVEEAVRGVDDVKRVSSVAAEGAGNVSVELILGADGDKVLSDVKAAVDRIVTFPEEAERPIVALASRRRVVVSLVIAGDQPLRSLHELAERSRARLLASPDITQVEIDGVPPLEVAIEISREALESHGLTLEQVAQQVRAASLELPGGALETRGGDLLVRVSDRRLRGHEFENIVLRGSAEGYALRLGDIAKITDGYADTDQASYYAGRPAVRLTAYRVGDETPIRVAEVVRDEAEALFGELPENIEIAVWSDSSEVLADRIDLLVRNGRMGLLLVLVILALFLRLGLAGWVALGIPISFMGAFAMMPGWDISINMVTLFAFIVTLGMVVDDAIVVGENIHEKVESGMERLRASIEGARELAVPVTFAILTTVAAFGPLFFVPGVMGKIFRLIPAVVVSVLSVSLVESFFVLPAHLAHAPSSWLVTLAAPARRVQDAVAGALHWCIRTIYRPWLLLTLRLRYLALGGGIALLIVTAGMVAGGRVPFSFFPKLEGDVVTAAARLPYGAPQPMAEDLRQRLEAGARAALAESGGAPILKGMFTRMGEGGKAGFGAGRDSGSHLVTVEVNLVPTDQREVTAKQFAERWEKHTAVPPGVEALSFTSSAGPGAGAAVDVQLSHENTEVLARASAEVTEILRGFSELTQVESSFSAGTPQLDFHLRERAHHVGLTGQNVARQLRSAFYGAEALREQRGRNELKVMVRLPEAQRRSEHDIARLPILTPEGGVVPLGWVARLERGRAPTVIEREDGRRIVDVKAELAAGVRSPQAVLESLREEVLPELLARYDGLSADLVGEQREQGEAFASLKSNFTIAMFIIFALLAIAFRSYIQPAIVMAAIPFGIVGAIGGHLLMGYSLSIISMFGIIALSGVVVNDSLVLIDATNRARERGMTPWDAIVWAGQRRLRPIMLTSLTTFFGLAPMILETSIQARFLIPMAISLGFGVLFATFIVLLLVPALYLVAEDFRNLWPAPQHREATPPSLSPEPG